MQRYKIKKTRVKAFDMTQNKKVEIPRRLSSGGLRCLPLVHTLWGAHLSPQAGTLLSSLVRLTRRSLQSWTDREEAPAECGARAGAGPRESDQRTHARGRRVRSRDRSVQGQPGEVIRTGVSPPRSAFERHLPGLQHLLALASGRRPIRTGLGRWGRRPRQEPRNSQFPGNGDPRETR